MIGHDEQALALGTLEEGFAGGDSDLRQNVEARHGVGRVELQGRVGGIDDVEQALALQFDQHGEVSRRMPRRGDQRDSRLNLIACFGEFGRIGGKGLPAESPRDCL